MYNTITKAERDIGERKDQKVGAVGMNVPRHWTRIKKLDRVWNTGMSYNGTDRHN